MEAESETERDIQTCVPNTRKLNFLSMFRFSFLVFFFSFDNVNDTDFTFYCRVSRGPTRRWGMEIYVPLTRSTGSGHISHLTALPFAN